MTLVSSPHGELETNIDRAPTPPPLYNRNYVDTTTYVQFGDLTFEISFLTNYPQRQHYQLSRFSGSFWWHDGEKVNISF